MLKIYVSHSIRGKFGADATVGQMRTNCQKAVNFGKLLRTIFPGINWYIPADHDEFVTLAFTKGYLNEDQILDVDCDIIDTCQGLLAYIPDDFISKGMGIEINYASSTDIPHVLAKDQQWDRIREFLRGVTSE